MYNNDMNIKNLRKITKMTQSAFAEYLNIPVANIRNWEQGFRTPPDYVYNLIETIMIKDGYLIDTTITYKSIDNNIDFNVKVNDDIQYMIVFEFNDASYVTKAPVYYHTRRKPGIFLDFCSFLVDDMVDEIRFNSNRKFNEHKCDS